MRNTLGDLNNHLFEQLERLNDEELQGEGLSEEINRSKAITDIASKIISNGDLVLKAQMLHSDRMDASVSKPRMLEGGE